jgi:hypothetical protein
MRQTELGKALRQAGIAVVETDHPVAGAAQRLDQGGRPTDELHAQTVDQQQHRRLPRAAVADFEIEQARLEFHGSGSWGWPACGARPARMYPMDVV